MKPIHLAGPKTTPTNQAFNYIQVIRNRVVVTDGRIVVVLPANEVFGANVIEKDEEIYFKISEWKDRQFYKSKHVDRIGLLFRGTEKSHNYEIKALTKEEFLEENKTAFPKAEVVFPKRGQVGLMSLALSLEYYNCACKIFGVPYMVSYFYGANCAVILKPEYSEGLALLMAGSETEPLEEPLDIDAYLGFKEPKQEQEPELEETDEEEEPVTEPAQEENWEELL